MKKAIFATALFVALGMTSFAQLKDGRYTIDYKASKIEWTGQKVTGEGHSGTVRISSGLVEVKGNAITSAKVKVDMNAIENTDIPAGEVNANLVNHLKAEDFFNSAKFPDANFEATSVKEAKDAAGNTHTVNGKLTVKGITQDIAFPAKVTATDNQVTIVGTYDFNRAKFEVKYGSETFMGSLGDKAINDIVKLKFNLIGTKK